MNPNHHPPQAKASTTAHGMEKPPKQPKPVLKVLVIILTVILLMLGSAYLGYWYRSQKANNEIDTLNQQIQELQKQKQELEEAKSKLQTELEGYKKSSESSTPGTPSAAVRANIEDAIKSGNTAALEGYMAKSVNVTIAASEGVGARTPAQAVNDINYVEAGTDPWNFSLPAATLAAWRAGDYKQYFPVNAVVGKSANNYVISFGFDGDGKINTVFMAVNADLLN